MALMLNYLSPQILMVFHVVVRFFVGDDFHMRFEFEMQ